MTEMSGRFLANGHELTMDELCELNERNRLRRIKLRLETQKASLLWLERKLKLPAGFDLMGMLHQIGTGGSASFYHEPVIISKAGGGTRILITPKPELMLVQKRINKFLLCTFKRDPNTFGYTGGNCYEVAQRHAEFISTFKFDVKDAFFQVGFVRLKEALSGSKFRRGVLSKNVAHWITQLCSYSPPPKIVTDRFPGIRSFLPQGAPTSPILFHLACQPLDRKLEKLARRVGGRMSRYADNYYFSTKTSRFPKKLEKIIACEAAKYDFPIHKARKVNQGELCRILGYNLLSGEVTNTRDFRRRLRGALYVLKTKLERGLEWREAHERVCGFMGMSVNLPADLRETYEYCEQKIGVLKSGNR